MEGAKVVVRKKKNNVMDISLKGSGQFYVAQTRGALVGDGINKWQLRVYLTAKHTYG